MRRSQRSRRQFLSERPATNAAVTFAHLGGSGTLATVVGRHELAGLIREEARRFGLKLIDLNPDFSGIPSISSVFVLLSSGERSVVSANAARAQAVEPVNAELLKGAHIVLLDGHHMESCIQTARAARALGITVVFDGGSWKERTEELLEFVDVAICSADFRAPANLMSQVRRVAVTDGPNPVRLWESGVELEAVTVPQVDAVDSLGAGDIFHGAFCYFYAAGEDFRTSLARAAAIAAEACRWPGTRAWMGLNPI